jgi:hypothetical protein
MKSPDRHKPELKRRFSGIESQTREHLSGIQVIGDTTTTLSQPALGTATFARPNTPLTQQMAVQLRLIESLRRSIHRQSNQLRAALYRVHPRMLDWFSRLTTQIALEFLIAYPTAQEAQTLSREAFDTFCRQQGYPRTDRIALRYAQLQEPVPSAAPARIQAYRDTVCTLAQVLLPQVRCRLSYRSVGHLV